jgi:putative zinc finger protein
MTCADISELCTPYLSGELEADRVRAFEDHLRDCPECAAEVELQRGIDSLLRGAILAERVDTGAIEDRARQWIAAEQPRRRLSGRVPTVIAAALVLSLAILGEPDTTAHQDVLRCRPGPRAQCPPPAVDCRPRVGCPIGRAARDSSVARHQLGSSRVSIAARETLPDRRSPNPAPRLYG